MRTATLEDFAKLGVVPKSLDDLGQLDESNPTLRDFANSLSSFSVGTVKHYRKRLIWLQKRIPCPLAQATLSDFNQVFADLAAQRHPSTVNGVKSTAKAWLRFLGRDAEADKIKIVAVRWLPRNPPPPEIIDKCFDVCKTPRESALLHVLYSFALRCSEASHVRACDVDLNDGRVRVWGKGGIPDYAVAWPRREDALRTLRRYLRGCGQGPIYNLEHSGIRWIIARVGKRANVHLTPHLLRHAGATSLIKQGADIHSVQVWLRHHLITMTMGYVHLTHYDLIVRAQEKAWR